MGNDLELPKFLQKEVGERSRRVRLRTPEEVREYCLSRDNPNITVTIRGKEYRYKIRKSKKIIAGWTVSGRVPLSAKAPGTRRKVEATIGRIMSDFKFRRGGVSLRDDDPLVQVFLEFFELVFVRNVMRPAEMKVEAEI